jgi:hypothetical protein
VAGVIGGHMWVTWQVSVDVVAVVAANTGHREPCVSVNLMHESD